MTSSMRSVLPQLERVMELARAKPGEKLHSLTRLLTRDLLRESYHELRKDAAVGVDGMNVEEYGKELEANLSDLQQRLYERRYRHQPIKRVFIPKEDGRKRPLGISTTEDKVVQKALTKILEAVYEQDFYEHSYGFRPKRSAHDAVKVLDGMIYRGEAKWLYEADIKGYFDNIDREKLMEMLRERIADEPLLRLVGKCLHVGVLEGEEYSEPELGTAQGSIISPLLGNIYLHHVLDKWMTEEVKPRLRGKAQVVRYADDFVIGFEYEEDARRVEEVIHKRFARFGLTLHEEKTRLIHYEAPKEGQKGESFNFLGFTHYWKRGRKGPWRPALKTRKERIRRAVKAAADFFKRARHKPVKDQHRTLVRKLRGHYNYFGVNGNMKALRQVWDQVTQAWHKWLNRRSQRASKCWADFREMLKVYTIPEPTIVRQIWG